MININDSLFAIERDKKKSRKFTLQSVDEFLASGGKIQSIANGVSGFKPVSTEKQRLGGRK